MEVNPEESSTGNARVRLFEFSASVRYDVVIAALSEADARDEISSWENSWPHNSEFNNVDCIEMTDERDLTEHTRQCAIDEANTVSTPSYRVLSDGRHGR